MLEKVGLITGFEREEIEVGLRSIEKDIEAGTFAFDESLEDIHMVVEDALGRRDDAGADRECDVATQTLDALVLDDPQQFALCFD